MFAPPMSVSLFLSLFKVLWCVCVCVCVCVCMCVCVVWKTSQYSQLKVCDNEGDELKYRFDFSSKEADAAEEATSGSKQAPLTPSASAARLSSTTTTSAASEAEEDPHERVGVGWGVGDVCEMGRHWQC